MTFCFCFFASRPPPPLPPKTLKDLEDPIYGLEPQKVFNKHRESFVFNWTPQEGEEPVRLFYVFEESSKKVVQFRIAGRKDVNKHVNKLRENHRCIIAKPVSEKMPQTRQHSLIADFRYKFTPFTTFQLKNIATPFNIQDVAVNFRVETVQSIQRLPFSKDKIVFKLFCQPTNKQNENII